MFLVCGRKLEHRQRTQSPLLESPLETRISFFFQFDCAGKCASSRWCCEPARVWGNPIRIITSGPRLKLQDDGAFTCDVTGSGVWLSGPKYATSAQTGCTYEITSWISWVCFATRKSSRGNIHSASSVTQRWLILQMVNNMRSSKHWTAVLWMRDATPSLC